ncbi:syndecan-3-like [Siniperca chuatsi]|uniref:syndecan-3-like n=1 Tax=Siniperca chuatsi TaxID=119488 RepID=UPI001CE0FCEB|nr:syndecan-3-like [Siniperca chuatsi]
MWISLTASLFLALGLIHPVNMSFSALPEDLEGSGCDLDSSGSGSGDWSDQGKMKNIKDHPNGIDVFPANAGSGTENSFQGSPILTFDNTHWPAKDSGSGFGVLANSKSFLENKDVFAGVIAGGVAGGTIAAALAAILIYNWHKKDDGRYILGQQSASDEDYEPKRQEVV